MTRGEMLLWIIALDYASCESWDSEEAEALKDLWREMVHAYSVTVADSVGVYT